MIESHAAQVDRLLRRKLVEIQVLRAQITLLLCQIARKRRADELRAQRKQKRDERERKELEQRKERERAAALDKRWRQLRSSAICLAIAWALILSGIVLMIEARQGDQPCTTGKTMTSHARTENPLGSKQPAQQLWSSASSQRSRYYWLGLLGNIPLSQASLEAS